MTLAVSSVQSASPYGVVAQHQPLGLSRGYPKYSKAVARAVWTNDVKDWVLISSID